MIGRLRSVPLAAQLAVLAALITFVGLAVPMTLVERTTVNRLVTQIDEDLRTQVREWARFAESARPRDEAELAELAQSWLGQQREHPASQLQLFQIGSDVVSNQSGLVALSAAAQRVHRTEADDPWLLAAPLGTVTATVDGRQHMRVSSVPLRVADRRVGTLRIADSLLVVERTRSSLRRDLLLFGVSVGLAGALVLGLLAASLLRPLRRVLAVAAAVDRGTLTMRANVTQGPEDVRRVGRALDQMLARLEDTFAREQRFIADASHELRTPLAVMRAEAESLRNGPAPPETRAGLDRLTARVDALNALVTDLLTLAAADDDPERLLERRLIDLTDYAADLERDLPLFGDRTYHMHACAGRLYGDPQRLDQVLRNLVVNAVRHTADDGQITIAFTPHDEWLRITITDDGEGMSVEDQDRAFERFGRGARSGHGTGTGLGLPICRALVNAHGGRIWLASVPGVGTTVHVELPHYTAHVLNDS